jgi:hypothetical protein
LERPAYGAAVTKYVLLQYEEWLGGDKVSIDPWIEHVLPATHSDAWPQFTALEHTQSKDLLSNLIPLSSEMNASLGNKSYEVKRPRYEGDSAFKSAREFAKTHAEWTPADLRKRSLEIAEWTLLRWPHKPTGVPQ